MMPNTNGQNSGGRDCSETKPRSQQTRTRKRGLPSSSPVHPTPATNGRSLGQLMDLTGQVAIVTGGAGHIGRAVCDTLAELGASTVVLDRDLQSCTQVAADLVQRFDGDARPLAIDLSSEEQVRTVADRVLTELGRIDILINCAAFVGTTKLAGWATDFSNQTADAWRQAMELNVTAPFVLAQSCAAALIANGNGRIINIASIYGMLGPDWHLYEGTQMANPAGYGVSKGGLIQLTRYLSTTLAPAVRVNTISPGGIERGQEESFRTRYEQRTPLKRMGREEDLKGAIAYLATDLSAWVTGQNLVVDGGWSVW
jgi:NAD(P)-dependent dehydrogenase (short-subunit alcohol dehydrogenase family)